MARKSAIHFVGFAGGVGYDRDMGNEISSPLQSVIAKLANTKIVGPMAQLKKRMDHATENVVLLLDYSGSMAESIGALGIPKYKHLEIALKDVLLRHPKAILIPFSYSARRIKRLEDLPEPAGGTNLGGAIKAAMEYNPRKTIIISDGLPDSARDAEEAVKNLTGVVDAVYCGPDAHPAIGFLQGLCRSTGGTQVQWNGYQELASTVRGLLCAPTK